MNGPGRLWPQLSLLILIAAAASAASLALHNEQRLDQQWRQRTAPPVSALHP